MENTRDEKFEVFKKDLIVLAEKHGVSGSELKTKISYNNDWDGYRYKILADLPGNLFIEDAKALFEFHFQQGKICNEPIT